MNRTLLALLLSATATLTAAACATASEPDEAESGRGASSASDTPISFATLPNFRDLGGLPVAGGGAIASHRLFRSEQLEMLAAEDGEADARLSAFAKLGVEQVVDFRGDIEKNGHADPVKGAAFISLPIVDPDPSKDTGIQLDRMIKALAAATGAPPDKKAAAVRAATDDLDRFLPSEQAAVDMMTTSYRSFVTQAGPRFAAFVKAVASGKVTLFHCVSGKDRTGFAAAIVLRGVGVSSGDVMHDYLESATRLREQNAAKITAMRGLGWTHAERLAPMLDVRPGYLTAAFAAIEERFGGGHTQAASELASDAAVAAYLDDLAPGARASLRKALLAK